VGFANCRVDVAAGQPPGHPARLILAQVPTLRLRGPMVAPADGPKVAFTLGVRWRFTSASAGGGRAMAHIPGSPRPRRLAHLQVRPSSL
jgi:hypothetical protein